MKSGKYKIDLPINNDAAEITVMVIVEEQKKEKKIEVSQILQGK